MREYTSKCGKNKIVAHKAITKCVSNVFTTFMFSVIYDYYWAGKQQQGIYLFDIVQKKNNII